MRKGRVDFVSKVNEQAIIQRLEIRDSMPAFSAGSEISQSSCLALKPRFPKALFVTEVVMPFRSKSSPKNAEADHTDPAEELAKAEEKLKEEAARLEQFLREEPERKRRELEEERRRLEEESSYLAPLDELQDRERERRFYEDLSRGDIRNRRRQMAANLFLLILLLIALLATAYWVYGIYFPE